MTKTLTPEDAAKLVGLTDMLRRFAADRVAEGLKQLEGRRAATNARLQGLRSELSKPLASVNDARAAAAITQETIDEDNRKFLAALVEDIEAERALLASLLAGTAGA